jgi:hypothetical protein
MFIKSPSVEDQTLKLSDRSRRKTSAEKFQRVTFGMVSKQQSEQKQSPGKLDLIK